MNEYVINSAYEAMIIAVNQGDLADHMTAAELFSVVASTTAQIEGIIEALGSKLDLEKYSRQEIVDNTVALLQFVANWANGKVGI